MKRFRRLRRLHPDSELYRRRVSGESLRALASAYAVSHTTLSRYFARPQAAAQLREAERRLQAERRALATRRPTKLDPSRLTHTAERAAAAGGGVQALIEATGLHTLANLLGSLEPALLEQAFANDELRAAAPGLRRLRIDRELYRRRAAGESLRSLAADYRVAHTTLSRHFARPQVGTLLREAARTLRAERRATQTELQTQRRVALAELRAERPAKRQARRLAEERSAAESPPTLPSRPGRIIRPRRGFSL
jgi:lambda repressor-like predicted transcriptional regulator